MNRALLFLFILLISQGITIALELIHKGTFNIHFLKFQKLGSVELIVSIVVVISVLTAIAFRLNDDVSNETDYRNLDEEISQLEKKISDDKHKLGYFDYLFKENIGHINTLGQEFGLQIDPSQISSNAYEISASYKRDLEEVSEHLKTIIPLTPVPHFSSIEQLSQKQNTLSRALEETSKKTSEQRELKNAIRLNEQKLSDLRNKKRAQET